MSRFLLVIILLPLGLAAASLEDRMAEARSSFRRGNAARAVELADLAVKEHPKNANAWFFRGQVQVARRKDELAVKDFDQALALDKAHLFAWQERGAAHFRSGRLQAAIKDWDEVIRLDPAREPHHWQRGIAYYYAGRYELGRKQFELHQTVNSADVENAVFHFICNAGANGIERARKELIPIAGDTRVPMMEIHRLYAGKVTAGDVLAAAAKGSGIARQRHEFYGHYYLGLFFEAKGDQAKTREHIFAAEKLADTAGYMGDCARVHARLLRERGE